MQKTFHKSNFGPLHFEFVGVWPRQRSVPWRRKAGTAAKPRKKLQVSKQDYWYTFQMSQSWKTEHLKDLEKGEVTGMSV